MPFTDQYLRDLENLKEALAVAYESGAFEYLSTYIQEANTQMDLDISLEAAIRDLKE